MSRLLCFFTVLALFFLGPVPAQAKILEGRIGIGASYQDFNNLTALSVRYHLSRYLSMTFLGGFDSDNSNDSAVLGIKLLRLAHLEESMNFYVGAGAAYIANRGGTTTTSTGAQLDGLVGAEFFLSGLNNLGFQFEIGIALRTVRNVNFASTGTIGIHYYF